MTPDPRISKVEAALAQLHLTDSARLDLPRRAYTLAMTAGFAKLNDRPEAMVTRRANGVRKEADKIGKAAFAAFKALKVSHGDTRRAFATANPSCEIHKVEDLLFGLVQAADSIQDDPRHEKPARNGRPSSRAAEMIADFALVEFEEATGVRATITTRHDKPGSPADGPFLRLLDAVFGAFAVEASPEFHGRKAIVRRRAGQEPGGSGGMVTIRRVRRK